ncbi:MAG: hypothetical protein GY809_04045, partial [Planctomycetes bacterium]|nr:hypothetical protein [Planctomycetota bacterium]
PRYGGDMGKLEKTVEREVRTWTEDQGGVWIKLLADGRKGIPDNLLLLPPLMVGRYAFPLHVFAELKRPHGGVLSPHQERWLKRITDTSHPAWVCPSLEHVQDVVEHQQMHLKRVILGARAETI